MKAGFNDDTAVIDKDLAQWDFFLSHTQRNGLAQNMASRLFFGFEKLGKKIWMDVMMAKMDNKAMEDGVKGSRCVLAIITGGDDTGSRYFQRPMCVQELKWAIEAEVKIVPVVNFADKPKVGEYIAEGIAAGIDLSDCDFKLIVSSDPIMMEASLKSILDAEEIAEAGKAKVVDSANAGSSVHGLAELLASLNLTQHLGAAAAWCVKKGADDVTDLKSEDFAEQLAEVLGLKIIPTMKLVAEIREKEEKEAKVGNGCYRIENAKFGGPLCAAGGADRDGDRAGWIKGDTNSDATWTITIHPEKGYTIHFNRYDKGPLYATGNADRVGDRRVWVKKNRGHNDSGDAQWLIEQVGTDSRTGKASYKINNLRFKNALYSSNVSDSVGDHQGWAKKHEDYNDGGNARWTLTKV